MHINRILVLTGGLVLIIGSRLPWISMPVLFGVGGPVSEALEIGWEDNGFVTGTVGLALILLGSLLKGRVGEPYAISGVILATLAGFTVLGCFKRILDIGPSAGFFAATDIGLYVTLVGVILALVGALGRVPMGRRKQDGE
jgi:hypothetical protein